MFLFVSYELRFRRVRFVTILIGTVVGLLSSMFAEFVHAQVTLPSERFVAIRLVARILQILRVFVLDVQRQTLHVHSSLRFLPPSF